MIAQNREPITSQELALLRNRRKGYLFSPLSKLKREAKFVDVYHVAVERCFIPYDFNEEFPVYILDFGGTLLVLFGQWLYDPHTLTAPANILDRWICDQGFFASFSIRCYVEQGIVLAMRVTDFSFVKTERLPNPLRFKRLRECELFEGSGGSPVESLRNQGLIF